MERQVKDSGANRDNTSRPTIGGYSQILITAALLHPEATFQVRSVSWIVLCTGGSGDVVKSLLPC
jgi:hypothetical protein